MKTVKVLNKPWLIAIICVSLVHTITKANAEENITTNGNNALQEDGVRKKLALLLFDEVPGNLVMSPLLLRLQLCKLVVAAHGPAKHQLMTVLRLKKDFQMCSMTVLPLLHNWQYFDSMWFNAIFVNDDKSLQELFFTESAALYGVDVKKVGFDLPTAATSYINRWASSQSLRRIPSVIDPDDIDKDTKMVLASGAYFKTFWYSPFLLDKTTVGVFRKMNNQATNVQMMHTLAHVAYLDDKTLNLKVAEIDLATPQMYMLIVVPNDAKGMSMLLKNMTNDPNFVSGLRKRMELTDLVLSIPRFRIKTYVGWQGFLEQIGLVDIFDGSSGGLAVLRKDRANTRIDLVKQHIFLQVEESSMRMPGYQQPDMQPYMASWDELLADRPFYFSLNFLVGEDHLNHEDFLVGVYYGP